MEFKPQKHIIDLLFVITLFCLFALSAIFLISIGANVYGKTVNAMEDNFNTRTSIAYITEKVRQSDQEKSFSIGQLDDCQAIVIQTQSSDTTYFTYLYEYEDTLRELTTRSDIHLGPEAGQIILSVFDFKLTPINDHLFACDIVVNEEQAYHLYISLHSGGLENES